MPLTQWRREWPALLLAAVAYALLLWLLLLGVERPAGPRLYLATGGAAGGFALILALGKIRERRRWPQDAERIARLILRFGLSVGGALVASYYLAGRLGWTALPLAILTALALIAGNLLLTALSWEILLYLLFGLLTTVVAILSFNGVNYLLYGTITGGGSEWGWFVPKLVSWTCAVLFAFWSNRRWVFHGRGAWPLELLHFAAGRLASGLVIEFAGLYLLENILGMPRDLANLLTALLVVIVNYFFSSLIVFRQRGPKDADRTGAMGEGGAT